MGTSLSIKQVGMIVKEVGSPIIEQALNDYFDKALTKLQNDKSGSSFVQFRNTLYIAVLSMAKQSIIKGIIDQINKI